MATIPHKCRCKWCDCETDQECKFDGNCPCWTTDLCECSDD